MKTHGTIIAMVLAAAALPAFSAAEAPGGNGMTFEYQGLLDRRDSDAAKLKATATIEDTTKPDNVRAAAFNERAICLFHRSEFDSARADLTRAIQLDGQSAYYANRGILQRMLGEWKEAEADYAEAIRIDAKNIFAHNNLGWLYVLQSQQADKKAERAKKLAAAKASFTRAIDIQAADKALARLPLARINLAAVLLIEGDVPAAEKALKLDLRADRDLPWTIQCALMNQGEVARCGGQWKAAEALYAKAYELGQNEWLPAPPAHVKAKRNEAKANPWILYRLGTARLVLGRYAQAAGPLSEAAEKFGRARLTGRYARLLASLAEAHTNGRKTIALAESTEEPKRWIEALELYLAGRLKVQALESAAEDTDEAGRKAKQCEMWYYMAQKKLLEGQRDEAKALFAKCAKVDDPRRLERTMALHEAK